MKPRWVQIVFLFATSFAQAQQESDSLSAINDAMRDAFSQDDEQPESVFLALVDRCWKIHDRNPGKPEQFDSLKVILRITAFMEQSDRGAENWRAAMGRIISGFCNDARVLELMDDDMPIPESLAEEADKSFASIAAATKSIDIKAAVDLRQVRWLMLQTPTVQRTDADTRTLVAMLKKLAANYPDIKVRRVGLTYKEWVKKTLYVIENLKIGHVVPEIEGQDLDGVNFKLSDYRGKVVMLVFWGYWCHSCREMFPHERSLVSRMENRPFALLGVNSDTDFAALKKKEFVDEKITWRSFNCGPEGTTGAIPSTWGIGLWPAIFLVDAKGRLRNYWSGNPGEAALDNAIESAIGEVEGKSKNKKSR